MNAIEQLRDYKTKLDPELRTFLDKKLATAAAISPLSREIVEQIADVTLRGGKRIRAALLYYSYLAHGGADRSRILTASMAMELMETFLLVHDDIIDNDSLRRGDVTIHKFFEKKHDRHYGTSMAILAGDLACSWSNEILLTTFEPTVAVRAAQLLNQTYVTEYYGQAMDIDSEIQSDITAEDIIKIHQLKTVPYTFDLPVKLGAILAGKNQEEIDGLDGYVMPLGTAFQIQDDILGTFGSEEKLGKPVTSDLAEGKKTLLVLKAIDVASTDDRKVIQNCLGKNDISLDDLEAVRKIIERTGSLDHSKKLAESLVKEAIASLTFLELEAEGKDFLIGIAEYMVTRSY